MHIPISPRPDDRLPGAFLYNVNSRWYTSKETSASFWDSRLPGTQNDVLDDDELRTRLESSVPSLWETEGIDPSTEPRIILVTAEGATTREKTPLQICDETLQYLIEVGGFDKPKTIGFLRNWLPFHQIGFEYDDNNKPTYMTLAVRLPRHCHNVLFLLRTHLATLNTFAFLTCNEASDYVVIRDHVLSNASLIRRHPLHFLSLIYQTRYTKWADWLADLWAHITEIEALTRMSHPQWIFHVVKPERARHLSNVNRLMEQVYGLRLEMDHIRTVMAVEKRFRAFCVGAMEGMEARRGELELARGFGRRERAEWEDMVTATAVRFDSVGDRVVELGGRLQSQIEGVHNMVARRNSEVALTVAQLQSHDSRMVKGIAILTLVFLPGTLISTIWTTDIFHLEGDSNWQYFAGATILVTLLVVLGWTVYVQRSKKKQEENWRTRAQIDNLNFSESMA
ncbi:hypothetical protein QBC39DRAFT_365177 [Podospora conica]|nr:hypothetical protein QBC39DRAFT_365177 [Schizothecium conicum]